MAHNARPRLLHPGIWQDPDLADLTRDCRLFFIGLISHADDHGKLEADARWLKVMIFPFDTDIGPADLDEMLTLLSSSKRHGGGHIDLYEVGGVQYLRHPNWAKYDKFRRPVDSNYPDPDGHCTPSDGHCTPSDGQCPPKVREVKGSKELLTSEPIGSDPGGWKEKIKKLPDECEQIIREHWLPHADLPASTKSSARAQHRMLDTLRLLHTADKQPWQTISTIVKHAATVWKPRGYIGSPASLREATDAADQKKWEAILGQISAEQHTPADDSINELIGKL